jgi:hypothetical protein
MEKAVFENWSRNTGHDLPCRDLAKECGCRKDEIEWAMFVLGFPGAVHKKELQCYHEELLVSQNWKAYFCMQRELFFVQKLLRHRHVLERLRFFLKLRGKHWMATKSYKVSILAGELHLGVLQRPVVFSKNAIKSMLWRVGLKRIKTWLMCKKSKMDILSLWLLPLSLGRLLQKVNHTTTMENWWLQKTTCWTMYAASLRSSLRLW